MISNVLHIACVSLLLLLLQSKSSTKAEFFTAIAKMEPLLELHKIIIDVLDKYIMKEEKRIGILKGHLQLYKIEHEKAMEDIPNYLENPINAFTLIKRLTTDLDVIEIITKVGITYTNNITMRLDGAKYPTMEDLVGAAQALARLQATYRLDVRDLAEGILNGVQHSRPMTAADCFELARASYNSDFNNTIAWSMEALRKFKQEKDVVHSFTESDILEHVSNSHYSIGDVKSALEWTNKLLELNPNHPRARGNIKHFEKIIEVQEKQKKIQRKKIQEQSISKLPDEVAKAESNYQALCRGEVEIPMEISKRLNCRYLSEHHPFLRLAPIKLEQVYINPDVYIFHKVISDDEIKFIQEKSLPRLTRAAVFDPKIGKAVMADYRISNSAWLADSKSEVVARLSQRVADMTGLSLRSAGQLQVVNYGIGGLYKPHYDFALKFDENGFSDSIGNRIATVMFYMSEVTQGGATVFIKLGLSVFPIKHAALFWMNLHPSGEGDLATLHAGCPVLRGSKWVCNKWLHQVGQELLKPCNLEYQKEGIIQKIPSGIPKTSSWLRSSTPANKSFA